MLRGDGMTFTMGIEASAPIAAGSAALAPPHPRLRDYVLLLSFSWLVGLAGVVGAPLQGHDEPRVAGIARAMALTGDYLTPRLNGRPFLEYPSLGYVPSALGLSLAGRPSELAARLPIVLLGGGTVLLLAQAGSLLGGRRLGLTAGYLLQTTAGFVALQRKLVVDPVLVFGVTLAMAGFIAAWTSGSRLGRFAFWLGLAWGFLAKGLVGIGLPLGAALGFCSLLQVMRWLDRTRAPAWPRVGWWWGPLVTLAPIAIWLAATRTSGGGSLVQEVIRQSLHRFASEQADHAAPWHAYLGPVCYVTFPLLALALADGWTARLRRSRSAPRLGVEFLLPACWLGVGLVALSIASAKRSVYLAPLLPGAALMGAELWQRVRARLPGVRWCEWPWLAANAAAVVALGWVDAHAARSERDPRELFSFVRAQGANRPLVLYRPSEGLEGAAFFYTGEVVAEARSPEDLAAALRERNGAIVIGGSREHNDLSALELLPGSAQRLARFSIGDSPTEVWSLDPRE